MLGSSLIHTNTHAYTIITHRYSWVHKRGTWDPTGTALWVPQAWIPTDPLQQIFDNVYAPTLAQPQPPPSLKQPQQTTNLLSSLLGSTAVPSRVGQQQQPQHLQQQLQQQQQQPQQQDQQQQLTAAQQWCGLSTALRGCSNLSGDALALLQLGEQAQPCVAALDSRVGGTSCSSSSRNSSRNSSRSHNSNRDHGASSRQGGGRQGDGRTGDSIRAHSSSSRKQAASSGETHCLLHRPLSIHQLGAYEPPELTAALQVLSSR